MKINHAAANLSFSGKFVYAHDGGIETMQVVRRVRDDSMQERLYALDGEAREIVRDSNRIWCYIPEQKVGVQDYRQLAETGFPRILPADLTALKRNYRFTEGGANRIADRPAQRINVIPNDGFRYGYRLWADIETGLLLRSDLVDQNGRVVERYLFVSIDFDSDISDHDLRAVTSKEKLVWYGDSMPKPATTNPSAATSNWQFTQLPAGYRLSKYIRRTSPMQGDDTEHIIFTDGLSTVSIFIKPATKNQSETNGLIKIGATNVHRQTKNQHRITVMGEAPAKTVEFLASGVALR